VNADPYRGRPLTWAAVNGHVPAVRALVALGAEPDGLGTFGGPTHGAGVPAINVAAQAGHVDAVRALLDLGADPTIRDAIHGGTADGWAQFAGHDDIAALLRERA
jgi:ankyrin repeat protein